jgi:Sec7-like guanine-nucleotide exchange factor
LDFKLIVVAEIATEDAVYVLAYSVILLNTDLHNPQNRVSFVDHIGSEADKKETDDY